MPEIVPIVLSGGSGTRLWPLSGDKLPKQFIPFLSGASSLFDVTLRRLGAEAGLAPPIIVCNDNHRARVANALARAKVEPRAIILEPVARNTAPAVAVAALEAARSHRDALLAVMPSDHLVRDETSFIAGIKRAAAMAATGRLMLLGIKPTHANTGYGYIRCGAALAAAQDVFAVDAFVEKPDRATAEGYLAAGDYFWNSGVFVLAARTFLDELGRHAPRVLAAAQAALDTAEHDLPFLRLDETAFSEAPDVSVDTAVMERTSLAAMLPLDTGWSDVGSWSSLWEITPKDEHGNAVRGDAVLIGSAGCYVHSTASPVATIGVKDLVIVEAADAVLVADKTRAQEVADLVGLLKKADRSEDARHVRSHRPWGYVETLTHGARFQVTLLHVNPGGSLSKQMRPRRCVHWIVVRGTAKVMIGDTETLVHENESIHIGACQWHRLENPDEVGLEIIEVQIGALLAEDDIVRCDDAYDLTPEEKR